MPKIVMNEKITFMDRVANYKGKLVVLLDVTRLLSEEEMEKVKKLKAERAPQEKILPKNQKGGKQGKNFKGK